MKADAPASPLQRASSFLLNRRISFVPGTSRPVRGYGKARPFDGPPPSGLRVYRMNFPTKGEVSPRRMKCPEGPSPRNSENQDSCSISSFRMGVDKSEVRWSLPAVRLQMYVYPR